MKRPEHRAPAFDLQNYQRSELVANREPSVERPLERERTAEGWIGSGLEARVDVLVHRGTELGVRYVEAVERQLERSLIPKADGVIKVCIELHSGWRCTCGAAAADGNLT